MFLVCFRGAPQRSAQARRWSRAEARSSQAVHTVSHIKQGEKRRSHDHCIVGIAVESFAEPSILSSNFQLEVTVFHCV